MNQELTKTPFNAFTPSNLFDGANALGARYTCARAGVSTALGQQVNRLAMLGVQMGRFGAEART